MGESRESLGTWSTFMGGFLDPSYEFTHLPRKSRDLMRRSGDSWWAHWTNDDSGLCCNRFVLWCRTIVGMMIPNHSNCEKSLTATRSSESTRDVNPMEIALERILLETARAIRPSHASNRGLWFEPQTRSVDPVFRRDSVRFVDALLYRGTVQC